MSKTSAIAIAVLCGAVLLWIGGYLVIHAPAAGTVLGGLFFLSLGLACLAVGGIACQVEE